MSHHNGHHGDDDSIERRHSEGEGFLEKVKEFFTGSAEKGEEGDAYESRHGNGVDDSGVLADAPLEDDPEDVPPDAPDDSETMENPDWADADPDEGGDEPTEGETADQTDEDHQDEARARLEEQFAREHDPATHDTAAGDEFRQPGDWVADEHGGPQVQEADGTVHTAGSPDAAAAQQDGGEPQDGDGDGLRGDAGARNESGLDEIRDGGHGWGSAAPIESGVMPLGHPVKAWHDTMTYVRPGEDGYEGADPHEWFVDDEAAQRAGFRHAHG